MSTATFADRYAEAGISPTAETIKNRQASVDRIVTGAKASQILDLVTCYFGLKAADPLWLRDQFAADDVTFSLVNNEREVKVLSVIMLAKLIAGGGDLAALAVVVGRLAGRRSPEEAAWLVQEAVDALSKMAVEQRAPRPAEPKVGWTFTKTLEAEVTGLPQNDWAKLVEALGKIRKESQSSMGAMATQANALVDELKRRTDLQREESQILWWVFSGVSKNLGKSFETLDVPQAVIVAAIDLGCLTTKSRVGPIAAPALLNKVISFAKKLNGGSTVTLAAAIDGLKAGELSSLVTPTQKASAAMTPIVAAIDLARTIGTGAWHAKFEEASGFAATIEFEPLELAEQLYQEHLLGQLL